MKKKNQKKRDNTPVQKLLASIDVFEDSIIASRYDNGQTRRRYVTAADLAEMFETISSNIVQWLPLYKNVVAVGTDSDGYQRYLVIRPAQKTTILCHIGKREFLQHIKMPNLLAELVAEKSAKGPKFKNIEAVYAFGGKVSQLKASTQLYVAPVPNVHDNGSICMGTVEVKRWAKLEPAEVFENAFIKSPFTDHVLDGHLTAKSAKRYRNILDALKKKRGNIPLNQLRKIKTYGKIFEK